MLGIAIMEVKTRSRSWRMKQMKRRHFLGYSLLFVVGCAATNSNGDSENSTVEIPKKLRLAVADVVGLEELQRSYEPFRIALGEVLGTTIEFFPVENYTAAAPALLSDRVDLVLVGPSEYVILNVRTNAMPIVGITRPDYYSIICVRADSPIQSVADLKGKTIALKDIGSTSGHLSPTKMLIDAKLNPKSDVTIRFLKKQGFSALTRGEVEAWAGSWYEYLNFLKAEGLSVSEFRVLKKSPLLPNDALMANSNLTSDVVEEMRSRLLEQQDKLLQSLISVGNDKYVGAKLVVAQDSDYDMIREVYQAIGQGDFLQKR
jgi:phosphonate transport system substrate-binding protein